ncbi:vacuole protein [Moniliophthora roreri MCA 2997]|uniref:Palmitoyltransferase n=1 Tax=Moniliophthora roreri (strain MCA 2997) TaxID=1381753 RepID=V2WZ80_MONRO|nr:vacuole protein [Moniliophthora roreri MCA 2997]
MLCSKAVFRCFKALERLGDRITGAAGPYFVGFAVVLLSTGLICFFDVIMPNLPYSLVTTPICILIALNLFMHYYYVVTIPPGFVEDPPREAGSSFLWASPRIKKTHRSLTEGVRWSSELNITKASTTRCRKCGQIKPERTHHCRICNRCVLKYDHHCPVRINQCVGLHNERHFVMFMGYLCLAALTFCILGYEEFFHALGLFQDEWQYHVPVLAFILIFILAGVLFFAVGVMFAFHIHSVMKGETSVEHHDNEHYRKVALSRAETFVNSYNLGRRKNLELFFNVGENGYPLYTLFFPFRILPYTDGRSWARRPGFDRHHGVRQGEELTDDDEEWD